MNSKSFSSGSLNGTIPVKRKPPVISSFEEFELKMPGFLTNIDKDLSILADYDGTLAPIADDPNKTTMLVEIGDILSKLVVQPNVFLAIISGRGLKDIQNRVKIAGVTHAGNHGFEIKYPDGSGHNYPLGEKMEKAFKEIVAELNEKVAKHNAWVEDKGFSLTYHYRDMPEELKEHHKQLTSNIIEFHGFKANQAHEAIEGKPNVSWNKGEAALFILQNKFGSDWVNKTKVIFVGDDTTDEDAMRRLQGRGDTKTFRISADPEIETYADFRLPKQSLVTDLLTWIANTYTT